MKKTFLFLLFICSAFSAEYMVTKIVDGDTIWVQNDKKILMKFRFLYIDTMESSKNVRAKKLASNCNIPLETMVMAGKIAKANLEKYIPPGTRVFIKEKGLDTRGMRFTGEIFIKKDGKDFSVNEAQILDGVALPFYSFMNKTEKVYFRNLEYNSRNKQLSIFKENRDCLINQLD